jgi:predicted dienelactone hydrolase
MMFRHPDFALLILALVGTVGKISAAYDPLALPAAAAVAPSDLTVRDSKRNRDVPIRVYLPAGTRTAPVVLFSHGLGGSREASAFLGKHWSARGYVVVFLQHPGSDTGVWQEATPRERAGAMRKAASPQNYLLRVKDVPAVLDQLETWNQETKHPFAGRLDLKRVGMSGHSFGAVTTQAVSGQTTAGGNAMFTDPRIDAAVIMSPSSPERGQPDTAFGSVKIPWLLMTGTKDIAQIGGSSIGTGDMKSRYAVFPALPPGDKYELVLHDAEHSAFTDRSLPGESGQRNPNHHRVILALSTAFWDAFLKQDADAKAWLNGDGPRAVMQKGDRWQKK